AHGFLVRCIGQAHGIKADNFVVALHQRDRAGDCAVVHKGLHSSGNFSELGRGRVCRRASACRREPEHHNESEVKKSFHGGSKSKSKSRSKNKSRTKLQPQARKSYIVNRISYLTSGWPDPAPLPRASTFSS